MRRLIKLYPRAPAPVREEWESECQLTPIEERQLTPIEAAELLLLHNLSDQQEQEYRAFRQFEVFTEHGNCYRVRTGYPKCSCVRVSPWSFLHRCRKLLLRHGKFPRQGDQYCVDLDGRYKCPRPDTLLSIKLLLESPGGEDRFLRTANKLWFL